MATQTATKEITAKLYNGMRKEWEREDCIAHWHIYDENRGHVLTDEWGYALKFDSPGSAMDHLEFLKKATAYRPDYEERFHGHIGWQNW